MISSDLFFVSTVKTRSVVTIGLEYPSESFLFHSFLMPFKLSGHTKSEFVILPSLFGPRHCSHVMGADERELDEKLRRRVERAMYFIIKERKL